MANLLDNAVNWFANKLGVESVQDQLDRNFANGTQVALLDGFTRAAQDAFIKRLSRRIADKLTTTEVPMTFSEANRYAHDLEGKIRTLPENAQDNLLASSFSGDIRTPYYRTEGSEFDPRTNTVYINNSNPSKAIHELFHRRFSDLNTDPSFQETKFNYMIYPKLDKATIDGFGKTLSKNFTESELLKSLVGDKYDEGVQKGVEHIKKRAAETGLEDQETLASVLGDLAGRDPASGFDDIQFGHAPGYNEHHYNGSKPFIENGLSEESALNSALSTEGGAEIGEILAIPGGAEWLKKNYPEVYDHFDRMLEKNPKLIDLKTGFRRVDELKNPDSKFLKNQQKAYDTYRFRAYDRGLDDYRRFKTLKEARKWANENTDMWGDPAQVFRIKNDKWYEDKVKQK